MRPIGSLRDALIAAGRDDRRITQIADRGSTDPRGSGASPSEPAPMPADETLVSKVSAGLPPPLPVAQRSEGPALPSPPPVVVPAALPASVAPDAPASGRSVGNHVEPLPEASETHDPISAPPRTQLVRGRSAVKRTEFHQDPVVGWLVIVGGPGLGAFRPIYEGNNTIGRASSQRIPLDFGDDAISSEEQAYLRYDSIDRKYLLVPNLAKTNIVSVNEKKPTGAVELTAMDLVTVGRTQLAFVPFCGVEFDWSELNDLKC